MRRRLLLPTVPLIIALALAASACSSSSDTRKTVTLTNTVTSGAAPTSSGPASSVTVLQPSGASASRPASASASASAAPSSAKPSASAAPTTSGAAFVKVDPLKVDCSALLSPADVQKALGATIGPGSVRIKDVPIPTRGVTGKIRCRYGSTDGGKTAKVTVILTQYKDAASADDQIAVTKKSEEDLGAVSSAATVKGYPARILLRSGGLIVMRYDDWTLSVVAADKLASNDKLTVGLPVLAEQVLTRVIKNG